MDPTIGFLNIGTHKKKIQKREQRTDPSPYTVLWERLHTAAATGTDALEQALEDVYSTMSCSYCRAHMREFAEDPVNENWRKENPEFYVFKLHTAANRNARVARKKASLPPPYDRTIARYRVKARE